MFHNHLSEIIIKDCVCVCVCLIVPNVIILIYTEKKKIMSATDQSDYPVRLRLGSSLKNKIPLKSKKGNIR